MLMPQDFQPSVTFKPFSVHYEKQLREDTEKNKSFGFSLQLGDDKAWKDGL